MTPPDLVTRFRAGDPRALARAITLAESGLDAARPVLRAARELVRAVRRTYGRLPGNRDGSVVTLAPQSQLRYPAQFAATSREVYLEGEAFFERENTLQMIFHNGRNEWKIYWKKKIRYFSSRR